MQRMKGWATVLVVLLTSTNGSLTAAQTAPSQREVDSLVRHVLIDLWTRPDFARRAYLDDLSAMHYNVRADLLPVGARPTANALPEIPGVEFTLRSFEDAVALSERTGQRVYFIDIGLLTFTATEATVRLGTDYAAPPDPGVTKLCCCSRFAYYTKHEDRWIFRGWGAGRCG